jgi:hypothetical protein
MKLFGVAVMAVLATACGGGAGSTEKVQTIGAAGGAITLADSGIRVSVPAGALSGEAEFHVSETGRAGWHRAVEVHHNGGAHLEREMHIEFIRPDGMPATEHLRIVRVDDSGHEVRIGDDSTASSSTVADDNGGHGELEPGDDKGHDWSKAVSGATLSDGTFALEDDHGEAEPGDDKGGAGEVEPGDDKGGTTTTTPIPDGPGHT